MSQARGAEGALREIQPRKAPQSDAPQDDRESPRSSRPAPSKGPQRQGSSERAGLAYSLWQNRGLVSACIVVSLGIATAYNYTVRPRYEAVARIEITKPSTDGTKGASGLVTTSDEWVQKQYALLLGHSLLAKVVSKYGFDNSQELASGPMLSHTEALRMKLRGGASKDLETAAAEAPVVAFRSRISLRFVPGTNLADFVFLAYDPEFAVAAANGLARTFVDQSNGPRPDEFADPAQWLAARLAAERAGSKPSNDSRRSGGEQGGSADFAARGRLAATRLQAEEAKLREARRKTASEGVHLDRLRGMTRPEYIMVPELSASASFQSELKELSRLESRLTDLSQSLGPKHPDVQNIEARIRTSMAALDVEFTGVVRAVEAAHKAAEREETIAADAAKAAEAEFSSLRVQAAEYAPPKRPGDAPKDTQSPAMRGETPDSMTAIPDRNVRLTRPAEVSTVAFPDRKGNLKIAFPIGLAIGVLLVMARARWGTPERESWLSSETPPRAERPFEKK